jgi:hypothetical protein
MWPGGGPPGQVAPDARPARIQPPGPRRLADVSGTEVLPEQETRVHEDVRPDTSHGDGDHERFAHYVDKSKIVDSMVTGTPVTALCGKVWVPSRDPKRYPVCPTCKEIYEQLPSGEGGKD